MKRSFTIALLALSLVAAACSAGEPEAAPETTTTTEAAVEVGSIVDVAAEAGVFGTLLAAAEAAGLAETLATGGPFTVLAPTDDAFAALPEGTLDALLADPEALADILLYHVIEGEVLAETVVTLDAATSLQGSDIAIAVVDGGVVLNESANVVTTDVAASNGVIHIIDAVILPPTDEAMAMGSIVDVAAEAGVFGTLLAAAEAAGLAETLATGGPFTVLAPTDDAFAALPEGTLDALLADPEALADILLYHVIEGEVLAETVVTLDAATSLQGSDIAIAVVDGGVVLNESANVVTTDVAASNGVIHIIDAVILPPTDEAMAMGSIVDVAAEAGVFGTLLAAAEAAGLAETLATGGPFTVLAPTDDAFAALPEGTLDALLADPEALADILLYHVIEGEVLAETVVTLDAATSLQGSDIAIAVVDGGVVLNESANVVTTDVAASNGVIHIIDAVILPPTE